MPKKEVEKTGNSIIADDFMPNMNLINYTIWGKCFQEQQPTVNNPQEVLCVGDLVTDSGDEHYGKYRISYTLDTTPYNIYLTEPLRGIVGYGLISGKNGAQYILDYIDFKTQKIVRNVGKRVISNISTAGGLGAVAYKSVDNSVYTRTSTLISGMSKTHPGGGTCTGDVISNYLQQYDSVGGSFRATDSFVWSAYEDYLYFYWKLESLGLRVETATADDRLLYTYSNDYYNVYDGNTKITDFSQIQAKIREKYDNKNIEFYYPLASPTTESIGLPEFTTSSTGSLDLTVATSIPPEKVGFEYYGNISKIIKNIEDKINGVTYATLSQGVNI